MGVARIDAFATIGESRRENRGRDPDGSILNAAAGFPGELSKRKEEDP